MNIVRVSVKAGTCPLWVKYFTGIPTLEKLKQVAHGNRDVVAVLEVAKPIMLSGWQMWEGVTCWHTPIMLNGTQIGDIDYKEMEIEELESFEQSKGFSNMSSATGGEMNSKLTELIVILDASGSMTRRKQDVIGGFNQLIDDQRKQPGKCIVTVVQFSSFGKQKTIVNRKPADEVAYLTEDNYRTIGWTALHDAIGSVVLEAGVNLADTPEKSRPGKVIVAIITDGEENHSQEYTASYVRDLVKQQRDVYNWEFLFTGANQDAVLKGEELGVSTDLSARYQDTSRGYRKAFRGISYATSALRRGDDQAACVSMQSIENE